MVFDYVTSRDGTNDQVTASASAGDTLRDDSQKGARCFYDRNQAQGSTSDPDNLPSMVIDGHGHHSAHNLNGWQAAGSAISDLASGAAKEITQHPLDLVKDAGIGAVFGAAVTAVGLAAPELRPIIGIAGAFGLGLGALDLAGHFHGWMNDMNVIANGGRRSSSDLARAHRDLQNVGAGATQIGAGALGGFGSSMALARFGPFTGAAAARASVDAAATDGAAPVLAEAPAEVTGSADSVSTTAPVEADYAPPEPPETAPEASGEAPPPVAAETSEVALGAETADTAATTAPKFTQQQRELLHTLATGADEKGMSIGNYAISNLTDQDDINNFALMMSKINPTDAQSTIENAINSGDVVPESAPNWNQALAFIRSVDSNQGIFKAAADSNGLTLSQLDLKAAEAAVRRAYGSAPGTPELGEYVAPPDIENPPVVMTKITSDMVDPQTGSLNITTPWGQMSGNEGDYLANEDYNTQTGTPGDTFFIVRAPSYEQDFHNVPYSPPTV